MKDYEKFGPLMERIIHKYNQVENKKRYYGSDALLTRTEIHTIVVIGENLGINVTTLAQIKGITKGAASQMVYKLVKKGFVKKAISPDSDTEVCLTLTEKGNVAFGHHMEYHRTANDQFFVILKNMPDEIADQLQAILKQFEASLDERLEQE